MRLNVKWEAIAPDEILDFPEETVLEELAVFGEKLKNHVTAYRNPEARIMSVKAWLLLKKLLEEIGEADREVEFTEQGKPFFKDRDDLFFSISHTSGAAAAAVSDGPVGVDIERVRPEWKESLTARFLTSEEQRVFQEDYTRAWCRKEAAAKITGAGIFLHPAEIDILSDEYVFEEATVEAAGEEYRLTAAVRRDIK